MDVRELDEARFRTLGHRHLAVIEARSADKPGHVRAWRLWCMNCGMTGAHVYLDRKAAMVVAGELRATASPPCQHRTRRPTGDPSP